MQNSGTMPPPPPGPTPVQPAVAQPNMPLFIQATPYRPPTPRVTFKPINRQAVILGSAQIVLGILCIIFNACGIAMHEPEVALASSGIWAGLFFIVTGPFGIAAGKRHTRGWYITYMILSIISAVFTISVIVQSAFGLGNDPSADYDYICPPVDPSLPPTTRSWYRSRCEWGIVGYPQRTEKIVFHALLLVCGLLEAIAAIWSSILCCRVVCCGGTSRSSQPGQVICYQAGHQVVTINGQPMVLVSQGQPGVMYAMPITQQVVNVAPPQQQQMTPVSSPVAAPPYSPQQEGERTPPPLYQEQAPFMGSEEKQILTDNENPEA